MRRHCSADPGRIASAGTAHVASPRSLRTTGRDRQQEPDEEGDHDHASRRLLPRGEHSRAPALLLSVSVLSLERPFPADAPLDSPRGSSCAPAQPRATPAQLLLIPPAPAPRRRPPTMKRKSWHASTTTSRSSSATRPSSA